MEKLKDQLENVHEWPAKHENRERFLLHEFPFIQYPYQLKLVQYTV